MHFRPERIPDGQTVPHRLEAVQAESVTVWRSGQRRVQLLLRLNQIAWWVCCVLVFVFIVVGAAKHPSQ